VRGRLGSFLFVAVAFATLSGITQCSNVLCPVVDANGDPVLDENGDPLREPCVQCTLTAAEAIAAPCKESTWTLPTGSTCSEGPHPDLPDDTSCDVADGVTGICASGSCVPEDPDACDAEPVIRTTNEGVEFVRTPSRCFDGLPDFPYVLEHVDIDGLRQGFVDEGPANGPVVLLLHGQPTWAFLYRKMIPILVGAGYRVVAMDHLGMGYSDKPIDIADYSYLGHIDRLERFITALGLTDITLFAQDWGSVIGLHVAGENPDWFARIVIGDGTLPVVPAGVMPYPPVENPNEIDPNLPTPFPYPAQQVPFYNGCTLIGASFDFAAWMEYAMKAEAFHAAGAVEAATWFDMPTEDEAAYDAPFPSRVYMAGIRVFPSLANEQGGVNQNAWAGLQQFQKPFLTIWASNDPISIGSCATQDRLINNIPGAVGLPHTRLPEASHFLQDDQGAEIASRIVDLISTTP
jgi:haloalkane dehalogenase